MQFNILHLNVSSNYQMSQGKTSEDRNVCSERRTYNHKRIENKTSVLSNFVCLIVFLILYV